MQPCVYLRDYDLIFKDLPDLVDKHGWNSILLGKKVAYSGGSSFAIYNALPSKKVTFEASPVMLMKASKNKVWKVSIVKSILLSTSAPELISKYIFNHRLKFRI